MKNGIFSGSGYFFGVATKLTELRTESKINYNNRSKLQNKMPDSSMAEKTVSKAEEIEEKSSIYERIDLGDVTPHNINLLKKVNHVVFPIVYHDKFYKDVLEAGELAKLAYYNDVVVGAVCCRIGKSYFITLGQNYLLYPKNHTLIFFLTFDKIHIFKVSFFTKFTFFKHQILGNF